MFQVQHPHMETLLPVDLVAAEPPCQGFSSAGAQQGWEATCSKVFPQVLTLIMSLFSLQPSGFTYIVENVPGICRFPEVEAALGGPVIDDAIWYGSASHRRTFFWSNAAHPAEVARRMREGSPDSRLNLRDFVVALPFLRHLRRHPGSPEFFSKFMCRVWSHAHRLQADGRPGPGMLVRPDGQAVELPSEGRELAMGFYRDSTAAPLVLSLQRHQALGNCIDLLEPRHRRHWRCSRPASGGCDPSPGRHGHLHPVHRRITRTSGGGHAHGCGPPTPAGAGSAPLRCLWAARWRGQSGLL